MADLKKKLAYTILVLTMGAYWLLAAVCQSENGQHVFNKTAAQRRTVNPKAPHFLIQAQDAFTQKIYNAALMLADSAEHYAPNLADVPFLRGLIYTELRRYHEAEAAYKKVLALDPYYQGAWLNMGSAVMRQGDSRKAMAYYHKELKHYPTAATYHQIGRVYAKLGNLDSARYAYEKSIAADSSFETAYFRLAELYKQEGDLAKALAYAREGLKRQPDNLNYRYFLGSLLVLSHHLPEAVTELEAVVKARPWHYWANYNLGQAFVRLGREAEGKRYLAKAESLQVELKNIQDWENLVENNPDQLMLWVNYGEALRRAGRFDEAIEAFQIALSIEPRFAPLENNLAILHVMRGDTAKAVLHYQSILQRFPNLTDVWLNLGVVYAKSGKFGEARKAWENALKYAPDDSTAKAYLAKLPRKS
ncbi:MAG: tetratricopeptide repeat protein [candidate division KSB1 bacterium]|nr:tetratricopeptide repeat protein [candidate division KSB1 bacterium]MDZ7365664.1 tetratricopeptide repeat protein [candidate division KSB1 bacterium]MDZ7403260.1 tetratricopeptide repeat protein [candidate division KSB1 bacterium]